MVTNPSGEGGFETSQTRGANSNNKLYKPSHPKITLSGAEWYSQQAHRAVNQAIGRVIRHRHDYGAILFLDSRFSEPRNQLGVSKWIRPSFEPDKGVGPVNGSLVRFYRQAEKTAHAQKEETKWIAKPKIILKYENNDEQSKPLQKKTTVVDNITKVSFIKANDDKAANDAGYITSDRVIKEVNLKDHTVTRDEKKNESITASKIRQRMQTQAKNRSPDVEEKQRKRAKFFFQLAQETLSPSDFQVMRKTLISMKSLGDTKDSEAYLLQSKKLVGILLLYDPCRLEIQAPRKSDNLVESLLPLLPLSYRYSIEKMACQMRYNNSALKDEFMKRFNTEECNILDNKVPALMINHNRVHEDKSNTDTQTSRGNPYLGDYHAILKVIMNKEKGVGILRYLYQLIPKGQTNYLRTLMNEYQATLRIKALKDSDKTRYGESGIKAALFQRPVKQNWKVGAENESKEEKTMEEVIEMKEALSRANSMKKDKFDDHQRSWELSRSELLKQKMKRTKISLQDGSTLPNVPEQSKHTTSLFSSARPAKKTKTTNSSSVDRDMVKCLEVANTEIYKKKNTQRISMNQVKSKAPRGMLCSICNSRAKEVSENI